MRSEGFPFIAWGSGGWTRVRVVRAVGSRARRGRVVNSVAIGGGRVACVALCRGDCWAGRRMGGARSLGLHVVSCHVMSCLVTSCHVLSRRLMLLTRVVDKSR